ncbi:MAG: hypothetical protein ACI9DC_001022 [Gammaproteobacteria bacterium]|jgi:hypothetical protein
MQGVVIVAVPGVQHPLRLGEFQCSEIHIVIEHLRAKDLQMKGQGALNVADHQVDPKALQRGGVLGCGYPRSAGSFLGHDGSSLFLYVPECLTSIFH